MAFCTPEILALASGIYSDLGSPTNISVGYISGYLTSSGNIGDLNNKLSVRFGWTGAGPCIISFDTGQPMDSDEQSIYSLVFKDQFYRQQALLALTSSTPFWTRLAEGDSSISRPSPAEISRAFQGLIDSNQKALRLAIGDYKRAQTSVGSVDAQSLYSFPAP